MTNIEQSVWMEYIDLTKEQLINQDALHQMCATSLDVDNILGDKENTSEALAEEKGYIVSSQLAELFAGKGLMSSEKVSKIKNEAPRITSFAGAFDENEQQYA